MSVQEKEEVALKRLSPIVRACRKFSGMTQTQLAQKLETSQTKISKIEQGTLMPSPQQWFVFCRIMGVDSTEAFETGILDPCSSLQLRSTHSIGSFKIPDRYAFSQGTSVRVLRLFTSFFIKKAGVKKFLRYCESRNIDPDFFMFTDQQLNMNFTIDLISTLIKSGYLKKQNISELTQSASLPESHGLLYREYNQIDKTEDLIKNIVSNIQKYEVNFKYTLENCTSSQFDLALRPNDHLKTIAYKNSEIGDSICQIKRSWFQHVGTYKGKPGIRLSEKECHFHGAAQCIYQIKFN